MKKFILSLLFLVLFVATPVLALDLGTGDAGYLKKAGTGAGFDVGGTTGTTFSENIGLIVKMALSLMGVIFTILMVYAGYLWMTARGKDEQIEKAQKIIIASIIGLVITLGAFSITNFIIPRILEATLAT